MLLVPAAVVAAVQAAVAESPAAVEPADWPERIAPLSAE